MKNKIKKLTIVVEKGGFMLVRNGEVFKQSITIKNNGQVWHKSLRSITQKEEDAKIPQQDVKVTEYKNIGKQNAIQILARAQEVLPAKIDEEFKQFVCDAIPDEIYIEYEDGKTLCGQSVDFLTSNQEILAFYEMIAELVAIDNLFFCNNYYENW